MLPPPRAPAWGGSGWGISPQRRPDLARTLVILLPLAWLVLLVAVPAAIVVAVSLAEPVLGRPPFVPALSARSYALLAADGYFLDTALVSLRIAGLATLLALAVGYPLALAVARSAPAWRGPLLLLVVLPFWTSFLVRVYAWMGILADGGPLNQALLGLGLIEAPLPLLYTDGAAVLGIAYAYLPFMVLPLVAVLERQDPALREAAADLGAAPWQVFLRVTLPLSLPGIAAGTALVLVPGLGEFVVPELLGGADAAMLGRAVWAELFDNRDWPTAAALAVAMLAALVLPLLLLQRRAPRQAQADMQGQARMPAVG